MNPVAKRVVQVSLFVAVLGALLVSWLAPKVIAWYFDPPVNIGVNCREAVEWSISRFRQSQLVGFAAGLVVGLFVAWRIVKREDPKDA